MQTMRLVAIDTTGKPADPLAEHSSAQAVCEAVAALYRNVGFVPPRIGYFDVMGSIVGI
jgi:hypothetical protein